MRISDWSSDVCSSDLVKITSGGVIYNVGDVVTIPAASVGGRGTGFSAPVTAVTNVANDIYRIKQSAFTSYKIGGSSGDRKSVVTGKSVSVRVDLGGRRIIKKKTKKT